MSLGSIIYGVVGILVAAANNYFANADALRPVLSAVLAVALWPLVLIGIDLHIPEGEA